MKKLENRVLLSSPTMHGEEKEFISEAFARNWVAPLGFNCDGFESEVNDYLGGGCYNFATVSGTSAIHLAVKLAGVKPGDPVLCSDLTFAATVNPVSYSSTANGKPGTWTRRRFKEDFRNIPTRRLWSSLIYTAPPVRWTRFWRFAAGTTPS